MTEIQTTQTETLRTFWHSDYRKMTDLIQSFRHVHCDASTAKPAASQEWADQLAAAAGAVFAHEAEVTGTVFSMERFTKDTQLPQASVEPGDDDETEDDEPGDDTGE